MIATRPRRGAVLLLSAALLLAAAPAAAAPPARASAEAAVGPSLFDTLAAWLAALWPASGPGSTPVAGWQAGSDEPAAAGQHGADLDPAEGPIPQPQHGPDLDPYG